MTSVFVASEEGKMDTYVVAEHIRKNWRELWATDNPCLPTAKQGIVCPLCGSGSGPHKSGVKEVPWQGKRRLKCFRCGFFGDAINLLAREMGLEPRGRDFIVILKEGMRRLSNSSSITVPPPAKERAQADYSSFFLEAQAGLEGARDYLLRRGISFDIAQKCGCGFVRDWINPYGGNAKSPRLIMPCDVNNYFARDTREIEEGFPKIHIGQKTLFDPLHALSSGDVVFVVEGGIDALAVIDAGGMAVAIMGCDGRQLLDAAKKAEFCGIFAVALDNDTAGKRGAKKLQRQFAAAGFSFGFVNICGRAKDPAEAHQLNPTFFRQRICPGY